MQIEGRNGIERVEEALQDYDEASIGIGNHNDCDFEASDMTGVS